MHNKTINRLVLSRRFLILSSLLFTLVLFMFFTGTLNYPGIMMQRQVQLVSHCINPQNTFSTDEFGFTIDVPNGYCAIPHRQFPEDGTVHIVPKGFYFVINEYAKGTITESAGVTIIFIKDVDGEQVKSQIKSLREGGFVSQAKERIFENPNKLMITEFRNATGLQEGRTFNWAFSSNEKGDTSVTLISDKTTDTEIFDSIEQSIALFP